MDARARKSRRILAAQQQLHRIEQWKVAQLESRLVELEAAQVELIGALNDTHALHGLFIDTMARRLGFLAEEADRLAREKDVQSQRLAEHAVKVRLAERLAQEAALDSGREEERKQLLDIVEQFLGRGRTSLP